MNIKEQIKENKEVIMTGFWAGIGFWTASKVVLEVYRFIKEITEMGY